MTSAHAPRPTAARPGSDGEGGERRPARPRSRRQRHGCKGGRSRDAAASLRAAAGAAALTVGASFLHPAEDIRGARRHPSAPRRPSRPRPLAPRVQQPGRAVGFLPMWPSRSGVQVETTKSPTPVERESYTSMIGATKPARRMLQIGTAPGEHDRRIGRARARRHLTHALRGQPPPVTQPPVRGRRHDAPAVRRQARDVRAEPERCSHLPARRTTPRASISAMTPSRCMRTLELAVAGTAADGAVALVTGSSGAPVVATIGLSEAETHHIARMGFPDYRGARAIEVAFSGDIDAPDGSPAIRAGLVLPLLGEERATQSSQRVDAGVEAPVQRGRRHHARRDRGANAPGDHPRAESQGARRGSRARPPDKPVRPALLRGDPRA